MSVKASIVGNFLFLALTIASANLAYSAISADQASSERASAPPWKSIPEDSTSWRREPFKIPEGAKHVAAPSIKQSPFSTTSDFTLQGIMRSNKKYYAIINGNALKTGDRIDSWTIAEISRQRVTLRREKELQIYDIYQGRIDRGAR